MISAVRGKIILVQSNAIRISKPTSFVNKVIEICEKDSYVIRPESKALVLVLNLSGFFGFFFSIISVSNV